MIPVFNEIILYKSRYLIFKSRDFGVQCYDCPITYVGCNESLTFKCWNLQYKKFGYYLYASV